MSIGHKIGSSHLIINIESCDLVVRLNIDNLYLNYGYYWISTPDGRSLYLHPDGKLYPTTQDHQTMKLVGWYPSLSEVKAALLAYKRLQGASAFPNLTYGLIDNEPSTTTSEIASSEIAQQLDESIADFGPDEAHIDPHQADHEAFDASQKSTHHTNSYKGIFTNNSRGYPTINKHHD